MNRIPKSNLKDSPLKKSQVLYNSKENEERESCFTFNAGDSEESWNDSTESPLPFKAESYATEVIKPMSEIGITGINKFSLRTSLFKLKLLW